MPVEEVVGWSAYCIRCGWDLKLIFETEEEARIMMDGHRCKGSPKSAQYDGEVAE